jgi:chromate transporter
MQNGESSGEAGSPQEEQGRPTLAGIFLSFLRLGATAFGGPAMVAHVRTMAVQQKNWLDEETFKEGVALCQTIPGATAMQTCAYVGLRLRGVPGAAAAFIGFGLPAFSLMLALSALYVRFNALPAVAATLGGLRALIVAVISHAALAFGRSYLKKWQDFLIAPIAAALFWLGASPILVVIGSAVLGAALSHGDGIPKEARAERKPFALAAILVIIGSAGACLLALLLFGGRLFDLSLLMMKVDIFAFGGGFASLPLMLHEVVDLRRWMDVKTFMDGIALGQVTPGPIVITSTFVGYVLSGPLGALTATVSIFLPSFVMVVVTSPFFARLNAFPLFRKAVAGILCSFVGLLASVAVRLGFSVGWDIPRIGLACAAFIALVLRVDLLWVVLGGIGISVLLR